MSENPVKPIYLGIGSNLGNKKRNIENTKSNLLKNNINILECSSYYESLSWPNPKNPKFLNIVVKIKTHLTPLKLIKKCKEIETRLGRKKMPKNSPRVCDIDIIDFNGLVLENKLLKLPHPRSHIRNFVLYPIKEIDPKWIHPIFKKNVDFLINELSQKSRIEITRLGKSVII